MKQVKHDKKTDFISSKILIKIITSLVIFYTVLLQYSCARNVTDLTPSLEIQFKLTFKEPIDTSKYNYYIALSNIIPQIPNEDVPPEKEFYFPTPGLAYDEFNTFIQTKEGINFYYKNFFKSWKWYITYQENKIQLFDTDGNSFNENAQQDTHFEYFPNTSFNPEITKSNNILYIKFNLSILSITNQNILRAAFFTTDKSDTKNNVGNLIDLNEQTLESDLSIKLTSKEKMGPLKDIDSIEIDSQGPADITDMEIEIF